MPPPMLAVAPAGSVFSRSCRKRRTRPRAHDAAVGGGWLVTPGSPSTTGSPYNGRMTELAFYERLAGPPLRQERLEAGKPFVIRSDYQPAGDQPQAIAALTEGLKA